MSQKEKKDARRYSSPRGIALIFVAGILTILVAIGMAFFAMTHSSMQSTVRYSDMVRADLLSRAGLAEAVVRLRNQAYIKTEDPGDNWFTVDYLRGLQGKSSFPFGNGKDDDGDGIVDNEMKDGSGSAKVYMPYTRALGSSVGDSSDRFIVEVSDAASKININAGDNLAVMLDNLCRVIGPPLGAANLDALQPRRWAVEADAADPIVALYATSQNVNDTPANNDIYYTMTDESGAVVKDGLSGRPLRVSDGAALYGDGYAIAGYRARHGAFQHLEDVKSALTYVERNGNGIADDPLELLELEAKFAALRDHITIGSWVDTNTLCVGKFEWVHVDTGKTIAIDRDKSWVIDDPVNDPLNLRGSLRGAYLSVMNGHGAGQLRRIHTNGIDWVEVEGGFAVTPGPISSYMIIAPEEALLMNVDGTPSAYAYPDNPPPAGTVTLPRTNADGTLVSNPKIDYSLHPLCIHRAPVNINTATDKVLAALFLGINVQHGHPQAVGTETEVPLLRAKWKTTDPHGVQPYLLTPAGLKRIPASSGKPILDKVWGNAAGEVQPPPAVYSVAYINNYDSLNGSNYLGAAGYGAMTEAHELAYRIVMARQSDKAQPTLKYIDPATGSPTATNTGVLRGAFRTYDDLYFRVVKPWDERRFADGAGKKARLATMLMANLNANTDILKFNPNIEWIDRWSRNYTDQEPVMVYTNTPYPAGGIFTTDVPAATTITASSVPVYTSVTDSLAVGIDVGTIVNGQKAAVPPLKSSQKDATNNYIPGAYITRSFRYKSDELIDKTDLNRSTTEFSFDSNGIFYVVSSGQVLNTFTGQMLAERKLESLVKVYDVWRESTQQQFVMGTLSKAYGDRTQSIDRTQMSCTGQLARDVSGLVERKGLITLPEPLLPLKARIADVNGNANPKNLEVVTDCNTNPLGGAVPLDAFENARKNPYDPGASAINVPEVLANRVLPARWDGQIVLSTNTSSYDPNAAGDQDTFLASFDGDTDTATCQGNGREQAKWPYSAEPDGYGGFRYTGKGHHYRCLQSIGLLGILNDSMISTDPGIPLVNGKDPFDDWSKKDQVRWIYPFYGISSALMPLMLGSDPDRPMYWNNVSVRMGALRTDGVYLTAPGVSGNTATLKYLYSTSATVTGPTPIANARHVKLNYQLDSKSGNLITMWAKPVWHQDDMRNHEFLNPGNEVRINTCTGFFFQKMGQYKFTGNDADAAVGHCGNRSELNDLSALFSLGDNNSVAGWGSNLHGGFANVNAKTSPNESPGFRVQPFRWSYVGLRTHRFDMTTPAGFNTATGPCFPYQARKNTGQRGHMVENGGTNGNLACNQTVILHYARPIIDTALLPEGPSYWPAGTLSAKQYGAATANPGPVWPSAPGATFNGAMLRWSYQGYSGWGFFDSNAKHGDPRDMFTATPTSAADPNPWGTGRTAAGTTTGRCGEAQDVKWAWAEPYGKLPMDPNKTTASLKCFGMNNLNYGNPVYDQAFDPASGTGTTGLLWHYRNMPEDGTYAVIDEFKISNKDRVLVDDEKADWANDRAYREMRTSRYYLPPHPESRLNPENGGPPTFTSQTLFQSLKGRGSTAAASQSAIVVRASWNVFTPRFMCEYQEPAVSPFKRNENLTHFNSIGAAQAPISLAFKGPFDYVKYNDSNDQGLDANPKGTAYSVNRPSPSNYADGLTQAGKGVEVELLDDTTPLSAKQQDSSLVFQDAALNPVSNTTSVLTNPAAANRFGDLVNPVRVRVDQLRYRVRFRYPVDPLVDDKITTTDADGKLCVDPSKQYLLDTPVFDDISVTYLLPVRILDFHEATE